MAPYLGGGPGPPRTDATAQRGGAGRGLYRIKSQTELAAFGAQAHRAPHIQSRHHDSPHIAPWPSTYDCGAESVISSPVGAGLRAAGRGWAAGICGGAYCGGA